MAGQNKRAGRNSQSTPSAKKPKHQKGPSRKEASMRREEAALRQQNKHEKADALLKAYNSKQKTDLQPQMQKKAKAKSDKGKPAKVDFNDTEEEDEEGGESGSESSDSNHVVDREPSASENESEPEPEGEDEEVVGGLVLPESLLQPVQEGQELIQPRLAMFEDAELAMSHLLSKGAHAHSLQRVKGLKGKPLPDSENVLRQLSLYNKFAALLCWRRLLVPPKNTKPAASLVEFFNTKIKTNAGERTKCPKVKKTLGEVLDCVFNAFHSFAATEARRWARRQQGNNDDNSVHKTDKAVTDFIIAQINVDERLANIW
jgi:hypothetical protein